MSEILHVFQVVTFIVLGVLFVPAFLDTACPVKHRNRPFLVRMVYGVKALRR